MTYRQSFQQLADHRQRVLLHQSQIIKRHKPRPPGTLYAAEIGQIRQGLRTIAFINPDIRGHCAHKITICLLQLSAETYIRGIHLLTIQARQHLNPHPVRSLQWLTRRTLQWLCSLALIKIGRTDKGRWFGRQGLQIKIKACSAQHQQSQQ